MAGNPTGAMGVPDYLGWGWKSKAGLPIVCVPGCPAHPDNLSETILYLLYQATGQAPMIPLDDALRPQWLFGATVHEGCDRAGYYEQGDFATEYGSPKCIVKLGCWGPVVKCNVPKRGWINGVGGCPNVGGICIGCTMPGFPDKFMPFMDEPPGARVSTMASGSYGSRDPRAPADHREDDRRGTEVADTGAASCSPVTRATGGSAMATTKTKDANGLVEMAWDPITRIVGSLGIYTKIDFGNGKVAECHSTSSIFRGYSIFMKGKDPRDAHFITSRICGICGDNHATCSCYAQNMAYGVHPPALGEQIVNLGEAAEYMFDHNIFQENLVGVDFCEKMVAETNPGVLEQANRTESPHAGDHGYKTIGDIMRSLNPFSGEFYREALQVSRYTREMFCLMEGRHVHPSTLYPGGVGTTATIQLFTDYYTRLMRYVEFMKRVVPMHDDLFDFFYQAMPGYEENGRRRVLLGCWGAFQDPDVCNFDYRDMTEWGRAMGVTPGVVVDGKLVTNDLVEINLGIRILLGHSFYDDWEDQKMFVTRDPLGNPVDRRHPWNQTTLPQPQKRDFDDKYSWVMSPRWFDGTDHLALDTGGGPTRTPLVDGAVGARQHRPHQGNRQQRRQIHLPKTALKPEVTFEWKVPQWSNTIERDRARTYFQAYAAAERARLHREGAGRRARGQDQDVGALRGARRRHRVRFHRSGARRAVAPHGDQGRQDRQLPPVPADPVEREPARQLRHARSVRGRGDEHADLRGERPRALQGHRHHARGAQLRPVPAVRRAHVPRQGQDAEEVALADPGCRRHAGLLSRPDPEGSHATAEPSGSRGSDRGSCSTSCTRSRTRVRSRIAEELLRSLTDLYGGGLERIMVLACRRTRPRSAGACVDDELVGSLLVAHGLHPDDVETRVEQRARVGPAVPRRARRRRRAARDRPGRRARCTCGCLGAATAAARPASRCS